MENTVNTVKSVNEQQASPRWLWLMALWNLIWLGILIALLINAQMFVQLLNRRDTLQALMPLLMARTALLGGVGGIFGGLYLLAQYVYARRTWFKLPETVPDYKERLDVYHRTYRDGWELSLLVKPFQGVVAGVLVYLLVLILTLIFAPFLSAALLALLTFFVADPTEVLTQISPLILQTLCFSLALATGIFESDTFAVVSYVMRRIFGERD